MTALCHQSGENPELWFPKPKEERRLKRRRVSRAVAVCHRCQMQQACLQFALDHDIRYGIWGGLTESERYRLTHPRKPKVKDRPPIPPPPLSEVRGVSWHAKKRVWVVVIRHGGGRHRVGPFKDQAKAEAAAIAKCNELGTHPRRRSSRAA